MEAAAPLDTFGDLWEGFDLGPSSASLDTTQHLLNGSGKPGRERLNPWGPYADRLRQRARDWTCEAYRAAGRASRALAASQCGTGETLTLGDEVVCIVDKEGRPQCPKRKEHRCGGRLCVTCGERWASRNFVVIDERLQLLGTAEGRQRLIEPLFNDAVEAEARAVEAKAILEDKTASADMHRAAASSMRSAKNILTRRHRAMWLVEGWEETTGRVVNFTHRDTMFPADAGSDVKRAALSLDLDRMSDRLRRLTLDDDWRGRACAWVAKLEMTYNVHDDGQASWHVHAHCIVWGRDYWPQEQLQDLWERHRAPGEAETDGVSVYIAMPKKGLSDVVKYAVKAISLSEHDPVSVGAAFVLATHGRRLLRLGGALNGLKLIDDDVDDNVEESEAVEANELGPVVGTKHGPTAPGKSESWRLVRSTLRTMSGVWVTPSQKAQWASGPAWEEKVRAIRAHVWVSWAVRVKNQGVEPYAPRWME